MQNLLEEMQKLLGDQLLNLIHSKTKDLSKHIKSFTSLANISDFF